MIRKLAVILMSVALFGCATGQPELLRQFRSAEVVDPRVQEVVHTDLGTILTVTEHSGQAYMYYVYLIRDLKQKGIVGLSLGEAEPGRRVILLDYELAQKGVDHGRDSIYRWQLRKILTHEVGHEIAGHAARGETVSNVLQGVNVVGRGMSYAPGVIGLVGALMAWTSAGASYANVYLYGREAELEADRKAIEYWKKLSWPCGFWVRYFEALHAAGIKGDFRHPTDGRLEQARELCPPNEVAKAPRLIIKQPAKVVPPEPPAPTAVRSPGDPMK